MHLGTLTDELLKLMPLNALRTIQAISMRRWSALAPLVRQFDQQSRRGEDSFAQLVAGATRRDAHDANRSPLCGDLATIQSPSRSRMTGWFSSESWKSIRLPYSLHNTHSRPRWRNESRTTRRTFSQAIPILATVSISRGLDLLAVVFAEANAETEPGEPSWSVSC